MENKNEKLLLQIAEIRSSYAACLPEKVNDIHDAWNHVLANKGQIEPLEQLHRFTHSLKGSAGTFGFKDISDLARLIDDHVKAFIDDGQAQGQQSESEISDLLNQLVASIEASVEMPE